MHASLEQFFALGYLHRLHLYPFLLGRFGHMERRRWLVAIIQVLLGLPDDLVGDKRTEFPELS